MKVSLEWLSDYVKLPAGLEAEEIAHSLTMATVAFPLFKKSARYRPARCRK